MPQLHETQMGQKFLMRDIPELIKAINRLADAIERMENKEENKEGSESK